MKDVHPPSRGVLTMAVGVMFLLGGLIVPSVGATADPNDESSVQDGESALSEDALLYSRDYDVTVPEAIRRLEVQSKADAVFARLQDLGPDRFAGAWIEHVPAFQAVAAFTGTSDGLGAALQLAEASGLSIVHVERLLWRHEPRHPTVKRMPTDPRI